MRNTHKLCIFDFETDGTSPESCYPIQIASVMVDPLKLTVIEGSEFSGFMRPPTIDNPSYIDDNRGTLNFHSKNTGKSPEELVKEWKGYPPVKQTWEQFVEYTKQYHTEVPGKNMFTGPIACGQNIIDFDIKIVNRLCEVFGPKYKGKAGVFYPRDIFDLKYLCAYWFESLKDPKDYSMDTLRDFFGLPSEGAHEALKDVYDTTKMLITFLNLSRKLIKAHEIKFEGALKK